jgi:hypothetical protein
MRQHPHYYTQFSTDLNARNMNHSSFEKTNWHSKKSTLNQSFRESKISIQNPIIKQGEEKKIKEKHTIIKIDKEHI